MEQAAAVQIEPAIYKTNLAALAQKKPALADRLRAIPEASLEAVPAETRDGMLSFRLDGDSAWFGRTSVPGVRADALLERFDSGYGNVLLPGIGQGTVVTRLLARMGACRALFVWEPDDRNLALALRLHSWMSAIEAGRLIFLATSGDELGQVLADWLGEHPGYLHPERIMAWPWSTSAELTACQVTVQQACKTVEQERGRQLAALQGEMAQAAVRENLLAILAPSAGEDDRALGTALTEAAVEEGRQVSWLAVTGPGDAHPLARARRFQADCGGRPGACVLLNAMRPQVRDVVPASVRLASWVTQSSPWVAQAAAGLGPEDVLAVPDGRSREELVPAVGQTDRLIVLPWPCLVDPDRIDRESADRPIEVAILADLTGTDPRLYGCHLPTHQQIWQATIELIRERMETFVEENGPAVLGRAESTLGIRIEADEERARLTGILASTVANTLLWQHLARSLIARGVRVRLAGRGWSGEFSQYWDGPGSSLAERVGLFGEAKLVVYGDVTGRVGSVPLLASACGAVCLARRHARDSEAGGLATLLEPARQIRRFLRGDEAAGIIKELCENEAERAKIVAEAVERIRTEHRPANRLKTLLAALDRAD